MATKKSVGDLKEADLKGKKVFVRVDLNNTRIRAAVPTIKYLMGHGSKVILFSHLDEQPEVQGPAVLVSTERVSTISPIGISLCVISPGIEELVKKLKARNTDVYLISEGFRQMINVKGYKALDMIGDGATDLEVRINILTVNEPAQKRENGGHPVAGFSSSASARKQFLGFDANELTSRSRGKATAVQQIRKEDGSSSVAVDLQQLNLHNVICQAKSGMGKTAVFVLSTLQQIEPVAGQAAALVLCHTRELAYQLRVFQHHFITEFILTKYYFLYHLTEFPSSTTAESCFGAAIKVHIMHSLFNDFCINRLE
ncbi:hypothetical protein GOBAR_AA13830 [Gossypium barbadense]|uniref:phosphoglycerate kinase n=1 Tax=Gossypium barbadense TaxID=3634 RepID=A0A2P5XU01_GOSBA|nr:hypothetical protein GOBAR_AA13830 [Gossypium barbadense]